MSDRDIDKDLDQSTKLAFDRTWLGEERTMLAWIRTATSLITFGFAIYSFFGMPSGAGNKLTVSTIGPRAFAEGLIGVGLLSLLGAAIQRRHAVMQMRKLHHVPRRSIGAVVAALLGVVGIFGFVVILFRF
ncbi:MAG: DUF202 domain-containing protein [Candidatus Eremiobacteraeota bacterium]|nr:DUF202 domain-containing protein [Candidatus Eremiobacteraeota bacterium]